MIFKPSRSKLIGKMSECEQCQWLYPGYEIKEESNGKRLCEFCRVGQTNPYNALEMFNDRYMYLPLEEDIIRLQKQTGLSFEDITHWFTKAIQKNNDLDGIPDFDCEMKPKKSLVNVVYY